MDKLGKDSLASLESRLEAIAPRGVSDEAIERMDSTIDQLAGNDVSAAKTGIIDQPYPAKELKRHWWSAAAVLLIGAILWTATDQSDEGDDDFADIDKDASLAEVPGYTLLHSVNRVDVYQNDGLIIPADGNAPHYRHQYHIVDEEKIRDAKTGDVVTIRQPRREIITVPVTQF